MRYIFLPLVDIYLLSHIKSLFLYGGKLPPIAGERGKNTVKVWGLNSKYCWLLYADIIASYDMHSSLHCQESRWKYVGLTSMFKT